MCAQYKAGTIAKLEARIRELSQSNRRLQREIAKLNRAQQNIVNAKLEWERTFDAVPDLIAIIGRDWLVQRINKALRDRLGLAYQEVLGRPCFEVICGQGEPPAYCPNLKCQEKDGKQIVRTQAHILGGEFRLTFAPLVNEQSQLMGGVHIYRDLTAHKKAERAQKVLEKQMQLAQKMEALGTLAGGITHEFNNSLTVILGGVQLAQKEIATEHPCQPYLELALKASNNAKELVRQILSFSHGSETKKIPLHLGPLLKEGLKFLRASLPATIEISHDLAEDSGAVLADPNQIQQVLMNLGANAAHAMKEKGGLLSVALTRVELGRDEDVRLMNLAPGSYYRVSFSDTGAGMEQKTLERVFEPFFTTKGPGEGTGMGLAVVHGIVTSCHGEITVSSRLGQGTTFEIYLPLIDDVNKKADAEGMPVLGGTEHILLVDDQKEIVFVAAHMLRKLGYRVTGITSGKEALELFRTKPNDFDAILVDQEMPHLAGLDLAREALIIRPAIPIIIMTGLSEKIFNQKGRDLKIEHIILKPLKEKQVAGIIRRAIIESCV